MLELELGIGYWIVASVSSLLEAALDVAIRSAFAEMEYT
jgi:hypothetical protein